ncbi:translocation/assembly module TamB domain-containing protein [Ralstonia solanacearum]|uniref:translocation/assembly module TamB domain-containing protein n=1 Tax=Ralstonia solanacearum TaxID=305 RepID=UPI00044AB383|nr:translocation/assembly module TamB domain-containing protein [Ralstonia solanacearum]EUJ15610.1 gramicidin S biosynthesis protein GrsT [Ralstonia solanacearum P673]MCL9844682.1 translocation/assembly module TamB [Ralstonia solanacearum]MCL9849982.1 translocation/assembly module TamB [Ralstonia solanacearum]MCL9855302.1 translocation/assembly module TamB [Ralstonia solanacearum]MCL9857391.1 translocation/assembly module TamB [Ralstonia solanacearum]
MDAQTPESAKPDAPISPRRGWGRRVLRWAGGLVALVLLAAAALGGWLVWALQSPTGTAQLWSLATRFGHAYVSGKLAGGTLRDGLSLRDLHVRAGSTDVRIDHVEGRWAITRGPWHARFAYLSAGNVDVMLHPTPSTPPSGPPASLALPLALDVDRLAVDRIAIRQGTSTTELKALAGSLHTDGTHHNVLLDGVETPAGKLAATLRMTGTRPYPLTGAATLATQFEAGGQRQEASVSAQLSGSLEALRIDATGTGASLTAQARIDATPFGALPFTRAVVSAEQVNPRAFVPGAPEAALSVHADLRPDAQAGALTVAGPVRIDNAQAGPLDRQKLPLQSLRAQVRLAETAQQLTGLDVRLAGGAQLTGNADVRDGRGTLRVEVRQLDLQALHGALEKTRLAGPVTVDFAGGTQHVALDLAGGDLRAQAQAVLDAAQIAVDSAQVSLGRSRLTLSGTLKHDEAQSFAFKGDLAEFDPSRLAKVAKGRINATFDTHGTLGEPTGWPIDAAIRFTVRNSEYAGLPMTGDGNVHLRGQRLLPSDARLDVAGNRASLRGSFGAAGDRMHVEIDAPQLARLQLGVSGALALSGEVSGTLKHPQVEATFRAQQLAHGGNRIDTASGRAQLRDGLDGPLQLELTAQRVTAPNVLLREVRATLDGTRRAHRFRADADGSVRSQPFRFAVAGDGALTPGKEGDAWNGTLSMLSAQGAPNLQLMAPVRVSVAPGRLAVGRADLTLDQTPIRIERVESNQGHLRSAGRVDGLAIARVLELVRIWTGNAPPVRTDLVIDGQWDLDLGGTATGTARIARRSGDLSINAGRGFTPLGLTEAVVEARGEGMRLGLRGDVQSTRVGRLHLDAGIGLVREAAPGALALMSPASPLSGGLTVDLPQLKAVGDLLGPDVALDGRLAANLTFAGTVGAPKVSGLLDGQGIDVALYDQGIRLTDGTVHVGLDQNVVDLKEVVFHGGDGTVRAQGRVQLGEANPNLTGTLVADRLQLFADPDRSLVLSGQARIANESDRVAITGKFRIDRGLFNLPKDGAPSLGDDVVIVRRADAARNQAERGTSREEKPAGRFSPVVDVDVDFGDNFRFKGAGADLSLGGQMHVHSEPLVPLRGTGSIYVRQGSTYEAFGRKLAIEQGILNFTGPINNPSLNILAMRRNQEVEAGVQVTGTVRQPRVKLVSEPNVADEDKLSWLMFGYSASSAGLGQQQAMSGAALGLLGNVAGKNVARRFGLDEFSIGPSASGLTDPQVVSVGKAISERIAVGYEQSLSTADSIVKFTWQLSRRWSVVARGGTINGASILFNKRF